MTLLKQTSLFIEDKSISLQEDSLANHTQVQEKDLVMKMSAISGQGYEVQAFILPACAKNAPHRRDRVWFVAYSNLYNDKRKVGSIDSKEKRISKEYRKEYSPSREFSGTNIQDVTYTDKIGFSTKMGNGELGGELGFTKRDEQNMWNSFPTQPPICGGNDGLPTELDSISLSKYRKESLMAYGNAIVPQVAFEIFKAIEKFELLKD